MNIMRMSISVLSISMARYTAGSRATLLKVTSFLKRVVGFIVQSVMLDRSRAAVNTTFWLLFFASLLFSPSGTMASPLQQDLGKFIWFSDLHVDPFYGTSLAYGGDQCRQDGDMHQYGNFGCDAPWHLIQETLTQAKATLPDPDFVLVTGDFSRHDNSKTPSPYKTLHDTMENVSLLLHATFPTSQKLHSPSVEAHIEVAAVSLGNNDVIPDYFLNTTSPNNTMLNLVADAFKSLLTPEEESTVRHGGYLARNISSHILLLSLNTVIYSVYHTPPVFDEEDPLQQFAWLEEQLIMARASKMMVYITGHIPPTLGSYAHRQAWHDYRLDTYHSILSRYSDVISAQLFGHLHSDEFRVPSTGSGVPLLISSSVTPVYRNNPSFRIVTYDRRSGTIIDTSTMFLSIRQPEKGWALLYTFRSTYDVPNLTTKSLKAIVSRMEQLPSLLGTFLLYLRQNVTQGPCNATCRASWICLFSASKSSEYQNCIHSRTSSGISPNIAAAIACASIVAAILAVFLVYFIRKHRQRSTRAYLLIPDEDPNSNPELR